MNSFLLKYYKKQKWSILFCFIFLLFISLVTMGVPLILQFMIDQSFSSNKIIGVPGLAILATALLLIIISGANTLLQNKIANKTNLTIRRDLMNKIKRIPILEIENQRSKIIQILLDDVPYCQSILIQYFFKFVIQIITFITISVILIITNIKMGLILILSIPIYILFFLFFSNKIEKINSHFLLSRDSSIDDINNIMSNMKILKGTHKQKRTFFHDFENSITKIYYWFQKHSEINAGLNVIYLSLQMIIIIAIAIYGNHLVVQNEITIGVYVAFIMYAFTFFGPIQTLMSIGIGYKTSMVSVRRVFDLYNIDEEFDCEKSNKKINKGLISVRDYSLPYNNTKTKKGISFALHPGKINIIKGENGSGKTTFIHSLFRFHEVSNNTIFIDSVDINQFSTDELRSKIAIVYQEGQVISKNIDDHNIHTSERESGESFNKFVENVTRDFKNKSYVNELSGGRKQLLSFLHALSKSPEILIIDEGFSNMDVQTVNVCMDYLYQICEETIVVIVTHDFSYIDLNRVNIISFDL